MLRENALSVERYNRLHPTEVPRVPYISHVLGANGGGPTPGTTRDRVSVIVELKPPDGVGPVKPAELTDTGGYGVYTAGGSSGKTQRYHFVDGEGSRARTGSRPEDLGTRGDSARRRLVDRVHRPHRHGYSDCSGAVFRPSIRGFTG